MTDYAEGIIKSLDTTPFGITLEDVRKLMEKVYLKGPDGFDTAEYATYDVGRFHHTLDLVHKATVNQPPGRLLEIGSAPYAMSVLLHSALDNSGWKIDHSDYGFHDFDRQISWIQNGKRREANLSIQALNLEEDSVSDHVGMYDVIVFGEVFEHLMHDPYLALLKIRKMLKPNGYLIFSTPNFFRIENFAFLLIGRNTIFDKYSKIGPAARHSREYTCTEIYSLMTYAGFEVRHHYTADGRTNWVNHIVNNNEHIKPTFESVTQFLRTTFGANLLGWFTFGLYQNSENLPDLRRPDWLYRDYPTNEMDINWDLL